VSNVAARHTSFVRKRNTSSSPSTTISRQCPLTSGTGMMAAPLDDARELPGLPPVGLQELRRHDQDGNLSATLRTRTLRPGPAVLVEPDGRDHGGGIIAPAPKRRYLVAVGFSGPWGGYLGRIESARSLAMRSRAASYRCWSSAGSFAAESSLT
jgi:hypothetical protein